MRTSTIRSHSATPRLVLPTDGTPRLALLLSAAIYVAAWLIGLLVAPAGPAAFASAGEVHAFFSRHPMAPLVQSLLVHGVAGLALAAWVTTAAHRLGHPSRKGLKAGMLAGIGAAVLSWLQVALKVVLVQQVHVGSTAGTDWAFDAINRVDSAKLLALGVLVGSYTLTGSATRPLPLWLRSLGLVLAPLLPLSGTAFLLDSGVLTALLYASLPLLLVWVSAVTTTLYRSRKPSHADARSPRDRTGLGR